MSKFNYVIKDLSGKVQFKSVKKFERADEALKEGNKKYKNNISLFSPGSSVDIK